MTTVTINNNFVKKLKTSLFRSIPLLRNNKKVNKTEFFSDILIQIEDVISSKEELKGLLENGEFSEMLLKIVRNNIISGSKQVTYSTAVDFIKQNVLSEMLTMEENTNFYSVLSNSYSTYKRKIEELKNIDVKLTDKDEYFLFVIIFIFNLFLYTFSNYTNKENTRKELEELSDLFSKYYIIPFSFVYRKNHTIVELPKDQEIETKLKNFIQNKNRLYSNYKKLKKELRDKSFREFDVSKPVIYENFREIFGKKFHSIIILLYPISKEGYQRKVDEREGITFEYLRLPQTVYLEILFNEEKALLIINKNMEALKKRNINKAISETLLKIFELEELFKNKTLYDLYEEGIIKVFDINVESIVECFSKAIENLKKENELPRISPSKVASKTVEELKKKLLESLEKHTLSYKEEIKNFIEHFELLGFSYGLLSRVNKSKKFLNIDVGTEDIELSSIPLEEIGDLLQRYISFRESIENNEKYRNKYDVYTKLIFGVKDDKGIKSIEIEYSKGKSEVLFNGMRRDMITELVYLLSNIF